MTGHARSEVDRAIGTVDEVRRATVGRSAEGTAATFDQLFVDLLAEQVRHSLEIVAALGWAVARVGIVRAQGEFFHASLERWSRPRARAPPGRTGGERTRAYPRFVPSATS